MENKGVVIFSTLNQITNYLVIRNLQPKKIWNITYKRKKEDNDSEASKNTGLKYEIRPDEWDENLKAVLREEKMLHEGDWEDIYLDPKDELSNFKELLEALDKIFLEKELEIYWHLTGGQRLFSWIVMDYLKKKDRRKDVVIYLEGNTERMIRLPISNLIDSEKNDYASETMEYACEDLTLKTAFRLMGLYVKSSETQSDDEKSKSQNKDPESSVKRPSIFRRRKKNEEQKGALQENRGYFFDEKFAERDFYEDLYSLCLKERLEDSLMEELSTLLKEHESKLKDQQKKVQKKGEQIDPVEEFFQKDYPVRNLLLLANKRSIFLKKKDQEDFLQEDFLKEVFKKLKLGQEGYRGDDAPEMQQSFPTGSVFEKLVGYQVLRAIEEKGRVIEVQINCQVSSKEKGQLVDELDIVLLTDTGQVVNIECKSGKMDGDNAKSHHYTTYFLAGVFGTPIFATPLMENEETKNHWVPAASVKAIGAADRGRLKLMYFDRIDGVMKSVIREKKKDESAD